jgi:ubiquinol-cytochrome c reductase iron-sulfur subunit
VCDYGRLQVSGTNNEDPDKAGEPTRRDFIHVGTGAVAAGGGVMFAWPLINQMNPSADTRALASIEFDVSKVAEGSQTKVMWRGKPLFIRHRTAAEIAHRRLEGPATRCGPREAVQQAGGQRRISHHGSQLHPSGLHPCWC